MKSKTSHNLISEVILQNEWSEVHKAPDGVLRLGSIPVTYLKSRNSFLIVSRFDSDYEVSLHVSNSTDILLDEGFELKGCAVFKNDAVANKLQRCLADD